MASEVQGYLKIINYSNGNINKKDLKWKISLKYSIKIFK